MDIIVQVMIMNESHYVGHELQFQTYGADIKAFARFLGKFTKQWIEKEGVGEAHNSVSRRKENKKKKRSNTTPKVTMRSTKDMEMRFIAK
jgi:hypothetical protein